MTGLHCGLLAMSSFPVSSFPVPAFITTRRLVPWVLPTGACTASNAAGEMRLDCIQLGKNWSTFTIVKNGLTLLFTMVKQFTTFSHITMVVNYAIVKCDVNFTLVVKTNVKPKVKFAIAIYAKQNLPLFLQC